MTGGPAAVSALLEEREGELLRFVARRASPVLLRFESADDLVQGVRLRALQHADSFRHESDEASEAWLYRVARSHLAHRRHHWLALKRDSGRLLRLDGSATGESRLDVAASGPGPPTFAARREHLERIARALEVLLDRDRELVLATAEGADAAELARRLGISVAAAERGRSRASERLRKTVRLLGTNGAGD